MPWGWECRAKLIKQVPAKPTERRGVSKVLANPGPNVYEPPQIFCGPGVDRIKRAPAYTFGLKTKLITVKPVLTKNARMFNIQRMISKGGTTRITHGLITPHIEPVEGGPKTPGPAAYKPRMDTNRKKPPAFTMQHAAKPPYKPFDMWTPPPNMYRPPIQVKKEPAYTLGYATRQLKQAETPGPGEHDPNFDYVVKKKPAYSFGAPYRPIRLSNLQTPAPNTYCEKKTDRDGKPSFIIPIGWHPAGLKIRIQLYKDHRRHRTKRERYALSQHSLLPIFMVQLRRNPAPTFGIRHSPYIGEHPPHLKSSKEDLALSKY